MKNSRLPSSRLRPNLRGLLALSGHLLGGASSVGLLGGLVGCHKDLYPCLKDNSNDSKVVRNNTEGESIGQVQQPLYVKSSVLWTDREIPVCWEDNAFEIADPSDRERVQQAVDDTWGDTLRFDLVKASNQVRFIGWKRCSGPITRGIRISVPYGETDNPHTTGLGKQLNARPAGMVLNFDFTKWSESCAANEATRRRCIVGIAIHEFGHALGFAHEQNRPDTNREVCTDSPQGTQGDLLMGPWDAESVMNYCATAWKDGSGGPDELSDGDVLSARAAYYPDLFDFSCLKARNQHDPVQKP